MWRRRPPESPSPTPPAGGDVRFHLARRNGYDPADVDSFTDWVLALTPETVTHADLERLRETRFHLARRNGYDPADVDTFVDAQEQRLSRPPA